MTGASSWLNDGLEHALAQALPVYLPTRRWFGDKARRVETARPIATFPIDHMETPAAFVVIDVRFTDGGDARYVLPVAVSTSPGEQDSIASAELDGQRVFIRDALLESGFRDWLMRIFVEGEPLQAGNGRLVVDRLSDVATELERLRDAPSRVLGVEQSNSSLVFGDRAFIKLFRRLQPGVNPDVELNRFLTLKTEFRNVPRYLGSITYESPTGEETVVAVAQSFVESAGDGWSFVLDLLRRHITAGSLDALRDESRSVARRLGDVTAGVHLALSSDPWTPDLAPEIIRDDDAERWSASFLAMLDTVDDALRRSADGMSDRSRELAVTFLEVVGGLRKRTSGFQPLVGRAKTRVHGDYHLGQILRTSDGDFVVIDFEGEPQRPIDERRMKTSPLKDVAGMLRSFAYARGTAAAWLAETDDVLPSDLVSWERLMRTSFLEAYVERARAGGARFMPEAAGDFQAAVAAWELDKAVYEVQYELNNRPAWLWIPLSAMLKLGEPGE